MRSKRIILLIFLISLGITLFTVWGYSLSLREQNKSLSVNIEQVVKRIALLESDKTMERITSLRAENTALKREIGDLASRCSTGSGNRGFLIKR